MSYTRGTFAALVDAVVPETPELAERGDEHVPGGLAADVDAHVVEALDDLVPGDGDGGLAAALGLDPSLPTVVALLLDLAAIELLVRRRARDRLQSPAGEFARGPFSRLGRRDRLRAVDLLETDGVLSGSDDVAYLAGLLVPLTQVGFYSDWGGDERGWAQAGYPGPADGYAVSMGYEVESFEDDWPAAGTDRPVEADGRAVDGDDPAGRADARPSAGDDSRGEEDGSR